jgi:transcriptional regulator GlxA family with amidase domain
MFRARYGESIGEHSRRLRLEWAERLVRSDEALASIAAHAGFADQSHFTREFRRRFGVRRVCTGSRTADPTTGPRVQDRQRVPS